MKRIIIAIVIIGIGGFLAMGLINIGLGVPQSDRFKAIEVTTPETARAKEIIGAKCVMCHSQDPDLPFYAKLPGAGAMINKHIKAGTSVSDLQQLIADDGKNEVMLAKLEQTIKLGTMPIHPFMLMHWNGKLTEQEKQDLLTWVKKTRADEFATGFASPQYANNPVQPLPNKWTGKLNKQKIELGNLLYHDKRLSGDDTISCASCHGLDKGGTDRAQFSTGVRGQVGGINAPTTFNAMFNVLQFWDGRAKDLADQAAGPPLNPIEMDSNWKQITGKLAKDAKLTALHKTIYGNESWTQQTITDAIAEFEKTLITPNSPLDQYLKGNESALNGTEKMGFALFNAHSCVTCHAGKGMGGQSFEKPVNPEAYYAFRGIEPGEAEWGRFNATKNEDDRYKLKVPLLRNIALTPPYLHDGNISDLTEVVKIMHEHFVPDLNRQPLQDGDAEKIAAMLLKNNGVLNGQQL